LCRARACHRTANLTLGSDLSCIDYKTDVVEPIRSGIEGWVAPSGASQELMVVRNWSAGLKK
jgi:hypothetical protein